MLPFEDSYKVAPDWTLQGVVDEQWEREPVQHEEARPRRRDRERPARKSKDTEG